VSTRSKERARFQAENINRDKGSNELHMDGHAGGKALVLANGEFSTGDPGG